MVNPIDAGAYVYGLRPTGRRRHKPGRPGTGRRAPCVETAEGFLPDHVPAYISWKQYQHNRAQMQANMAARGGPTRAGSALLSGVLICGRGGLRLNAQYNNNGHAGRYVWGAMKSSSGDPFCPSLTAAPLDALVADLVLRALAPAALEASLALAADLAAEPAALDQQWQQRGARGRYQADRARRQYAAVEPENRLVARPLEQDWEAALAEQTRLEAEYERFRSAQAAAPSATARAAIQALAQDVPALWQAETTTREERQTIVRRLLERVLVTVVEVASRCVANAIGRAGSALCTL